MILVLSADKVSKGIPGSSFTGTGLHHSARSRASWRTHSSAREPSSMRPTRSLESASQVASAILSWWSMKGLSNLSRRLRARLLSLSAHLLSCVLKRATFWSLVPSTNPLFSKTTKIICTKEARLSPLVPRRTNCQKLLRSIAEATVPNGALHRTANGIR